MKNKWGYEPIGDDLGFKIMFAIGVGIWFLLNILDYIGVIDIFFTGGYG